MEPIYRLHYWPILQGRGEFIRLIFEDSETPYVDVARLPESEGGGMKALLSQRIHEQHFGHAYAPPLLEVDGRWIGQMPNICLFVARRCGLAPEDDPGWLRANQLMLTICDVADEAHDTHHPLGPTFYYEDHKEAASIRSKAFTDERMGRFFAFFEHALKQNGGDFLCGACHSYVDLAMFQLLAGLEYAFPKAYGRVMKRCPSLQRLRERIERRPTITSYLASARRLPFNEYGVFRHYPELEEG